MDKSQSSHPPWKWRRKATANKIINAPVVIHHVTHIRQLLVSTSVFPHCFKEHLDSFWSDLGPGLKLEFGRFLSSWQCKTIIIDTVYAYGLTYRFFRECVYTFEPGSPNQILESFVSFLHGL